MTMSLTNEMFELLIKFHYSVKVEVDERTAKTINDLEGTHIYMGPYGYELTTVGKKVMRDYFQQPIQKQLSKWAAIAFDGMGYDKRMERAYRHMEECMELWQAMGITPNEIDAQRDYTYSRPVGTIESEIGGVYTTFLVLADVLGVNSKKLVEDELERIWKKIDRIRVKNANKPRGTPVPGHVPDETTETIPLDTKTKMQMAVVMGIYGTPEQQEEARTFLTDAAKNGAKLFDNAEVSRAFREMQQTSVNAKADVSRINLEERFDALIDTENKELLDVIEEEKYVATTEWTKPAGLVRGVIKDLDVRFAHHLDEVEQVIADIATENLPASPLEAATTSDEVLKAMGQFHTVEMKTGWTIPAKAMEIIAEMDKIKDEITGVNDMPGMTLSKSIEIPQPPCPWRTSSNPILTIIRYYDLSELDMYAVADGYLRYLQSKDRALEDFIPYSCWKASKMSPTHCMRQGYEPWLYIRNAIRKAHGKLLLTDNAPWDI